REEIRLSANERRRVRGRVVEPARTRRNAARAVRDTPGRRRVTPIHQVSVVRGPVRPTTVSTAVSAPRGGSVRFRVERDVLAEAVAWTARSLPSRPPVPVLAGLLVEAAEDGLTLSG